MGDLDTAERRKLAKDGKALPDGSFPIRNRDDLKDAIQSYGRAKDKAEAKRLDQASRAAAERREGAAGRLVGQSRTQGSRTQGQSEAEERMECVHRTCRCQVQEGQDFCSDHCRQRAAETGHEQHTCECGHPACTAPIE